MNTAFERTTQSEDWCTPPEIVKALGVFNLDPCASHYQTTPFAPEQWFIEDNAHSKEWDVSKRIWMNPPYGRKAPQFIEKLSEHGNGIALIFARVDTKVWHDIIFKEADAVFFFKGRLKFYKMDGTPGDAAGAPSALVAFGTNNVKAIEDAGFTGQLIKLK